MINKKKNNKCSFNKTFKQYKKELKLKKINQIKEKINLIQNNIIKHNDLLPFKFNYNNKINLNI